MRKFNVYSPLIVVYPGEQFEWELDASEAASVTVQSNGNWPLTQSPYTVTAGTPLPAFVNTSFPNPSPNEFTFSCTPAAPNVTTQQIVVANGPFDVCADVNVNPGDYFIWKNDTNGAVTIAPDPGNDDFWPLASQSHEVPAGDCLVVQVPSSADSNKSYDLIVTFSAGGGCPQATQPKIMVGSPG